MESFQYLGMFLVALVANIAILFALYAIHDTVKEASPMKYKYLMWAVIFLYALMIITILLHIRGT